MRDGENKKSSRKVVKMLRKRWIYPAVYLASAAVIITGALLFQSVYGPSNDEPIVVKPNPGTTQTPPDNSVSVTKVTESLKVPVVKADGVKITKHFYSDSATSKEQEDALVFYNDTYSMSTGIDIASEDGKTFDVAVALSGTVTRAEKDSLLGNVIEVKHPDGLKTLYQGLENMKVEVGATVAQGQVIGTAGQSILNKEAGIQVHFEVRKDEVAVNPESYFNKTTTELLSDIQKKQDASAGAATEDSGKKDMTEDKTNKEQSGQ